MSVGFRLGGQLLDWVNGFVWIYSVLVALFAETPFSDGPVLIGVGCKRPTFLISPSLSLFTK